MSLQVWLPLKGNLENLGLANINVDVMGTVPFSAGKIGSAATFSDSSANCINFDGLEQKDNFSWTCWIKVVAGATHRMYILSEGRDCGYTGVSLWISNANALYFRYGGNNNGVDRLLGTLESDVWYHVAIIVSSDGCKGYLNGTLVNTWGYVEPDYTQSQGKFVIGKMSYNYTNTSNYFPFKGQINDVRIYDHCLSAKEVKLISQALVCHYPLNDFISSEYTSKFNVLDTDSMTYDSSSYLSYQIPINQYSCNVNNVTYQIELTDINVTNTGKSASELGLSVSLYSSSAGYSEELKRFIGTEFFTNGHADKLVLTFNRQLGLREGYVSLSNYAIYIYNSPTVFGPEPEGTKSMSIGSIKMYEVPFEIGGTVYDVSGYGNNGTMSDTPPSVSNDSPRYLSCMEFAGTNNYIEFQNLDVMPAILPKEWSIAFWVYNDDVGNRSVYFSNWNLGGIGGNSFGLEKSTSERLRIYCMNGSFDLNVPAANLTITGSEWIHLCVTKNSDNLMTIYKNGSSVYTYTNNYCTSLGKVYRIGADQRSTTDISLKGKMSDFRIYATALSTADVKELYETSASVDNHGNMYAYEFNELDRDMCDVPLSENGNGAGTFTITNNEVVMNGYIWVWYPDYQEVDTDKYDYHYNIEYSSDAGNMFYIGWEKYDANKTATTNSSTVYVVSTSKTAKSHETVSGDLSMSNLTGNPTKYIRLRILNSWSGSTSSNLSATIHKLHLYATPK